MVIQMPYVLMLIGGLIIMVYASNKTIDHAVDLASAFGIPHFLIGFILISLGTDLPEIINSIMSSYLGHATINVGDSLGSVLSQQTLVLGLLPFIGGELQIKRKEVSIIGCCLLLALIIIFSIFENGTYTQINALFLIISWVLFAFITSTVVEKGDFKFRNHLNADIRGKLSDVVIILIGLAGIGIGSYMVVESVIFLAKGFQIPEFFISFFIVGIGTSLPELVVDITAIRKKHFDIAVGDILGSCLVDATFSIGIGHFLFPNPVSTNQFNHLTIYTMIATFIVILLISLRKRVDRKAGIVLVLLYLFSIPLIFLS